MREEDTGTTESDSEKEIGFAGKADDQEEDGGKDTYEDEDKDFVDQFTVHSLKDEHLKSDCKPDPDLETKSMIHVCKLEETANQMTNGAEITAIVIPEKTPVLSINSSSEYKKAKFEGVCLDTGAATSVCGLAQAKAYARFAGFRFRSSESQKAFRFGAVRSTSMGNIVVRMPIPGHSYVEICVDVVGPNIPLLIGLEALDRFRLHANNIQNLLVHDKRGLGIPLTRKGRSYVLRMGRADSLHDGRIEEKAQGTLAPCQ